MRSSIQMGKLTKAELVGEVSRAAEITKKDADVIFNEIFRCLGQAINRGEKIKVRGFGSFRVRQRSARCGRSPKTGAAREIPAKRVPSFTPGKDLKQSLGS